ncbi:hypothetical protein [Nocardioides mesophilus]|uniref:Uncharacterized protein n=1 Tax=Nocardioides mesophilus TaxID=433659 RepID=A0A7G9RDJ6_9ACTN|nr:hypothetical protein [Nocardioides mesophilus]QNN53671.1 hypothetical protein H9L09_04415 [Nocardioides mesophilus]
MIGKSPEFSVVIVLALLLAPLVVRSGRRAILVAAASATVFVPLLPGFLQLTESLTGAGPVLWRLLMLAPVPVAVGLLGTVDLPRLSGRLRPVAGWGLAAALMLGLVAVGVPLWSAEARNSTSVTDQPAWKVDPSLLTKASRVAELDPGPGPVLLPLPVMTALPLVTTDVFAVIPRYFYARFLTEPADQHAARMTLFDFVSPVGAPVTAAEVDEALNRLDVSLVCLRDSAQGKITVVERAGYEPSREVAGMFCLAPRGTGGTGG